MLPELRQLRYFVTVAEELHFGRAAARLHMTQPPLSLSIRALENQLGAMLFQRTQRSVSLTAAGAALLPEARRLLDQASQLALIAQRAAAGESGTLRLAFVSTADYSLLPDALHAFRQRYERVRLELREATTDVQLEELIEGRIDAGLLVAPVPDSLRELIDYHPLLREPLVLAVPRKQMRFDDRKPVALHALEGLPFIVFPRKIAPTLYDAIMACLHEAGVTPTVAQEAIQMQTIVGLVAAGMGVALVPQSVSNLKRPGVAYCSLARTGPIVETGLAWRKDHASPVVQAFLNLLRKKN